MFRLPPTHGVDAVQSLGDLQDHTFGVPPADVSFTVCKMAHTAAPHLLILLLLVRFR